MKEQTKKNIKENLQLLGLVALSSIVVFHTNSLKKPADTKPQTMPNQKVERTTEKTDTVVTPNNIVMMNNKSHTR